MDFQCPAPARNGHSDTETPSLAPTSFGGFTLARWCSLADVPLGAFLSGGVDPSAIVALMQRQTARPVRIFTVGFKESGFDESPHARAVARHLGTEHHEMFVTSARARDLIPRLPVIWDEPFADSSQIPTMLVCQAARREVTVALSGDAGDEVFGGYNRYLWSPRLWRRLRMLPYPLRQALATALRAPSPAFGDRLLGNAGVVRPGEKLHKLAHALHGAYVAGLGQSVREWALRQAWAGKAISLHEAKGILIAGLGVLARYCGYDRSSSVRSKRPQQTEAVP